MKKLRREGAAGRRGQLLVAEAAAERSLRAPMGATRGFMACAVHNGKGERNATHVGVSRLRLWSQRVVVPEGQGKKPDVHAASQVSINWPGSGGAGTTVSPGPRPVSGAGRGGRADVCMCVDAATAVVVGGGGGPWMMMMMMGHVHRGGCSS